MSMDYSCALMAGMTGRRTHKTPPRIAYPGEPQVSDLYGRHQNMMKLPGTYGWGPTQYLGLLAYARWAEYLKRNEHPIPSAKPLPVPVGLVDAPKAPSDAGGLGFTSLFSDYRKVFRELGFSPSIKHIGNEILVECVVQNKLDLKVSISVDREILIYRRTDTGFNNITLDEDGDLSFARLSKGADGPYSKMYFAEEGFSEDVFKEIVSLL